MALYRNVKRDLGIDLLRCASILYIIAFWHLIEYSSFQINFRNIVTKNITYLVLGCFVFISGYYLSKKNINFTFMGICQFYWQRIVRIYPLFFCALVVFALLKRTSTISILFSTVFISPFLNLSPPTLWFVIILFIYYLLTPIFLFAISSKNPTFLLIALGAIIVFLLIVYGKFIHTLDVRIILFLPTYIAGVYRSYSKRLYHLLFILIFVVSVALIIIPIDNIAFRIGSLTIFILSGAAVLFYLFEKIKLKNNIFIALVMSISSASYCAYLYHRPIYQVLSSAWMPASHNVQFIYLYFVCVPLTLLLSFGIQLAYNIVVAKLKSCRVSFKGNRYKFE